MNSPPRTPNKWLAFVLAALGIFMSTLDGSIVNVALPAILADFSAPLATVQWVVLVYLLTITSLLLSFGRLSDIRGRKWVYIRGLLLFSGGSLFCALSPGAGWLIGARAFQGVGAAMLMACTPALLVDSFPVEERGRALGMMGAVVAGGLTLGPALGGMLLGAFSWHYIFWINVPVGLAAALAAWRLLPPGRASARETFDRSGSALLILFLAPLLTALSQGRTWGWTSVPVLTLLAVSGLSGFLFFRTENRLDQPILDLNLFRMRIFSAGAASAVAMFTALFCVTFLMPFYLMTFLRLTPSHAGAILMVPFFFLFVGAYPAGRMYDRVGSRVLTTLGLAILAVALLWFTSLDPGQGLTGVYLRLAATGLGVALFAPPNNAAIMSSVPATSRGVAAATVATARNLGMMFGVAMAAAVFSWVFSARTHGFLIRDYTPQMAGAFLSAFHWAMAFGAVAAAAGSLAAFLRGPDRPGGTR
ncbi:MAG: MFS transporter [Proteobacteria bacterium]|nr:MFS transporter [Pseudomonadota bacterium]